MDAGIGLDCIVSHESVWVGHSILGSKWLLDDFVPPQNQPMNIDVNEHLCFPECEPELRPHRRQLPAVMDPVNYCKYN